MATITPDTVYTKTAKGIRDVSSKAVKLPRGLGLVFLSIDGKATVADLQPLSGMSPSQLEQALETLMADGYIHHIASPVHQRDADPPIARSVETDPVIRQSAPQPTAERPRRTRTELQVGGGNVDLQDLAKKLTARVHAERRARDEAGRSTRAAAAPTDEKTPSEQTNAEAAPQPPTLDAALNNDSAAQLPVTDTDQDRAASVSEAAMASERGAPKHDRTPASALERAMMHASARAGAGQSDVRDISEVKTGIPMLDDCEPLHERLNVDRAAHDVLAHAADARRAAEAGMLDGHAIDARQQRTDEEARRAARTLRQKTRAKVLAGIGVTMVVVPALAVACLQFVPLNAYIPEAEQALSDRLGKPTTVSTVRYVMLPSPRIILEGVAIGNTRVERVEAHAMPHTLSEEPYVFETVEAHGVTIDATTLGTLAGWTGERSPTAMHVTQLQLFDVKLEGADSGISPADGEVIFERNGALHQAVFTNDQIRLDVAPERSGLRLLLNARDSRIPFGPAVKFSYLTIAGVTNQNRFSSTEMSGRIGGGTVQATLQASWEGAISVAGDFKVRNVRVHELMPMIAPDFSARGLLTVSGRYALQAQSIDALLAKPIVEATFSLARGELTNIDLVRATQGSGSSTYSGARTTFDVLTGSLQLAAGQHAYRQLQLSSAPLNAQGSVAVTPGGQLSGRVNTEVIAAGAVATRTALTVRGTVKEPQLAN
jgi:hypothetical protein